MKIHSLSVGELAKSSSWAQVLHYIGDRLILGSYPKVVLNPDQGSKILTSLWDSILSKDILTSDMIRKKPELLRLVHCLAQNIGSVVPLTALGRECGLTSPTVESYINLLEQVGIVKQVFSYSNNLANELKKSRKIYFCDLGIRNAVLNEFGPFNFRSKQEKNALWENFVFMERLKLHESRKDGVRMFFWRDKQKHEIDIIEVDKHGRLTAIECKLSDDKKRFPSAFCSKYPDTKFCVASEDNFFKLFSTWFGKP